MIEDNLGLHEDIAVKKREIFYLGNRNYDTDRQIGIRLLVQTDHYSNSISQNNGQDMKQIMYGAAHELHYSF